MNQNENTSILTAVEELLSKEDAITVRQAKSLQEIKHTIANNPQQLTFGQFGLVMTLYHQFITPYAVYQIKQMPAKSIVFSKKTWGKWYASRSAPGVTHYDYLEDNEPTTKVQSVPTPNIDYISPTGWQNFTHYFDTAEECQTALKAVGITNVTVVPIC